MITLEFFLKYNRNNFLKKKGYQGDIMYKGLLAVLTLFACALLGAQPAAALSDSEFDEGVKKANELYIEGDSAKCFSYLKQLEIKARKSGLEKHCRILVYMMRLNFELGFNLEAKRIKKEIDGKLSKIKNDEFLKNLHMAAAAIYANLHLLKEAGDEIKKSFRYGEAAENLFTYAMIMAKSGERDEAYKTIDRIFELNSKSGGSQNEEIIMNNMTAAIIALSFEDFSRARGHIDTVIQALAKTADTEYFVYIYKALVNNIFSFFEYNPLNLQYYETIHKMALERGLRHDAAEISIKMARILSDLGIYKQAVMRLDEATALLDLNSIKLNNDDDIKALDRETLERINQIANIFINCGHYDAAAKLFEDLLFIYEKQGRLKDSFDKIRALALCKFRQNNGSWKPLAEELIKTCVEIGETHELMLGQNFIGERLLEAGELTEAEKIFKALSAQMQEIQKGDSPGQSNLYGLFFTLGFNMAKTCIQKNDPAGAIIIIDSYLGIYESYKTQNKNFKNKKRKSGGSLTNFTVNVEFSASEIAEIAGKLYFMKAKLLLDKKDYENSYKLIAVAFDLLKNTDQTKNFYDILKFIVTNEDKFKDKKLHAKFKEIQSKYEQIITAAKKGG